MSKRWLGRGNWQLGSFSRFSPPVQHASYCSHCVYINIYNHKYSSAMTWIWALLSQEHLSNLQHIQSKNRSGTNTQIHKLYYILWLFEKPDDFMLGRHKSNNSSWRLRWPPDLSSGQTYLQHFHRRSWSHSCSSEDQPFRFHWPHDLFSRTNFTLTNTLAVRSTAASRCRHLDCLHS